MPERETWSTRVGFILAAVGSAVGLGNIWQFPFQTAQNGGAAFVVVYLAAVFFIGFPAMLSEFVIGRRTERNPIDAFRSMGGGSWSVVGAISVAAAFWILSFYSVIGGWVLRYIGGSLTGAYFADSGAYFETIATGLPTIALHAVFMAIVIVIVAFGVEDGIELGTKVMVPSIVVLLAGLAGWAATLDGSADGYDYYVSPDLSLLAENITSVLPAAVGQAFFTLSLGMGAMLTYASYLGEDDSLPVDGATIVVANTCVGLLAGLVVFPILFAQGIQPEDTGAGTVFVTLAEAFAELPAGRIVGVIFFVVLLLAALSSAISLLEVVVSYVIENTEYGRAPVAAGVGGVIFLLGVPTALSGTALTWYNDLAYNLLLPLSVLGILVFVGWVHGADAVDELVRGTSGDRSLATVWLWAIRTVVIVAVVATLALGVWDLAGSAGIV